jgi:hypothetical protein
MPLAQAMFWRGPKRNPFTGDPSAVGPPTTAVLAIPTAAPIVGTPPALGADATQRVTAIVSGSHPVAIVEFNAHARLVTVGDRISGRAIVAIDPDGVLLDDGSALHLAAPGGARNLAP